MPFCPICKANHSPEIACCNGSGRLLHEAGIAREPGLSEDEFRQTVKRANWFVLLFLLLLAAIAILALM